MIGYYFCIIIYWNNIQSTLTENDFPH